MSRANGKHKQRPAVVVEIDPDSPEGRQLGMSKRTQGVPSAIPGGRPHLSNAPTVRHSVPTPDSRPEIGAQNAHGAPPGTHTNRERADLMRGPNTVRRTMPEPQHPAKHPDRPAPIPVYVVEDAHPDVLRSAAPHHFQLQASTGEAVRLCGIDRSRVTVMLLNESTSSDIRFAQRPADLNSGGGALLPWPVNSYQKVDTQDELYAISADSGTPAISVIQIFERERT